MTLVKCGECGRSVQQEKSIWVADPDFMNGDPERAWHGGPVIFCPSCKKKRDKRIVAIEKSRRSRPRRKAVVLDV